jgi:hypothetical protein
MKPSSLCFAMLGTASLLFAQAVPAPTCLQITTAPPRGGAPNAIGSSLSQGTNGYGLGPIEHWHGTGVVATSTHNGATGMPVALFLGSPATGFMNLPIGSLDLDLALPIATVYDGIGIFTAPTPGVVAPIVVPYGLPAMPTGMYFYAQGVTIDPTSPVMATMTARNDIGQQNTVTTPLGAPRMAPYVGVTVTPVPPSTSALFPYARDSICPNNGQAASGPGMHNGTVFSALGANFNASIGGATTATVNGIAVDILAVRPNEILFSLLPSHVPTIAGPMIITSTGGTYTPSADQMESWVFCTPSNIGMEVSGGGYGGTASNIPSGMFAAPGGHQAVIGQKNAPGEVDYYKAVGVTPGTAMKVFAGEIDLVSGQILTQCSGLPPTPAALCYTPTGQPNSQQWYYPNQLQDTWLHHGQGNATVPFIGSFIVDQDDGGPGTCSFAGASGIPGSATQPGLDPDGPFIATGTDWIVLDDFPNPTAGAYPYTYIVITHW